jgi:hypothetical protein
LLKIANLFKLIFIRDNSGMAKTIWNLTFRKLKSYLSHVRSTVKVKVSRYTPWRLMGGEEV